MSAISVKQTDTVQVKNSSGTTSQVFVIKKKDGTAIWLRAKPITLNYNSSLVTLKLTTTNIAGSSSSSTVSSSIYYVKAGEKPTFSATAKAACSITSTSGSSSYDLTNVSGLTASSFSGATYTVNSKADSVTVYSVTWVLDSHMTVANKVSQTTSSVLTFDVTCDSGYEIKSITVINTATGTTSSATAYWNSDGSCTITGINSSILIGILVKKSSSSTSDVNFNNSLYIPNNTPFDEGNIAIGSWYNIIPFTDSEYSAYELFKVYNDNYDGRLTGYINLPSYVLLSDATNDNSTDPTSIGFWKIIYDNEASGSIDDPSYYGILGIKRSYLLSNEIAVSFYAEPTVSITLDGLIDDQNTLANTDFTVPEGCLLQGIAGFNATLQEGTDIGYDTIYNCWSNYDRLGENKVLYGQPTVYYESGYSENSADIPNNSCRQMLVLPQGTFILWAGFDAFTSSSSYLEVPDNCEITSGFDSASNTGYIRVHNTMSVDLFKTNLINLNFDASNINLILPLNSNIQLSGGSVPLELCGVDYLSSQNKLLTIIFDGYDVPIPVYIKLYKAFDDNDIFYRTTLVTDMSDNVFNKVPITDVLYAENNQLVLLCNIETLLDENNDNSIAGKLLMYFKMSDLNAYNSENGTTYTGFSYISDDHSSYSLDCNYILSDEINEVYGFIIDERSGYTEIEGINGSDEGYRACILTIRGNMLPDTNLVINIGMLRFS